MLNLYNKIPGFVDWCRRQRYALINDANAKYYYILFQQDRKCATRDCINCNGEFIGYENEEQIAAGLLISKRCIILSQEKRRKEAEILKNSFMVPVKYDKITWDNITISPSSKAALMSYAQKYPDNNPHSLYIYSKNPTKGKTTAAWVLVRDLLAQLKLTSLIIKSITIFLTKIREDDFTEDGINYAMKAALSCDLLALDDFGMEKQTAWSNEKLYTILNERSNHNKPTIIVSCIPPDPMLWQSPFEHSIIGKINKDFAVIDVEAT